MSKYLSKDRELELGTRIQKMLAFKNSEEYSKNSKSSIVTEGEAAVKELVSNNIALVKNRAHAFKSRYPSAPDIEDLIQEGMIGMMTAVYKFDPKRNNKFSTVAYQWIEQAISRGTNKTGRLVRLPENRIVNFSDMAKIESEFEHKGLSQKELDAIIMDELGLSREEITNIRNAACTPKSLNRKVGSDDNSSKELIDIVGDKESSGSAEDFVMKNEIFEVLHSFIDKLDPIEKDVLASSFSLSGVTDEILTPRMVREKYNLRQSKFKKIQLESIQKIKENLSEMDIQFFDFME